MRVTIRRDGDPPPADGSVIPEGAEWARVEMEVAMVGCHHRRLITSWALCSSGMLKEEPDRVWSALRAWGQRIIEALAKGDCPVCLGGSAVDLDDRPSGLSERARGRL